MQGKIAAMVCVVLAGCATPKTREEMLALPTEPVRVCAPALTPEQAVERLQAAWNQCFVRGPRMAISFVGANAVAYPEGGVVLTHERKDDTHVLSTRLPPSSWNRPSPLGNTLLLMAEVRQTGTCPAEVTVRASNDHWRKRARQTEAWLADPRQRSPEAGCDR